MAAASWLFLCRSNNCIYWLVVLSNEKEMIFHFAIFLAQLSFKVFWDKRAKDSGRIINHFRSALLDIAGYCTSIFVFIREDYIGMISLLFLTCMMRWTLFDICFNIVNKDKWNHTGNSSVLDVFLDKIDGLKDNVSKYGIVIKGIGICLFAIITIYRYV